MGAGVPGWLDWAAVVPVKQRPGSQKECRHGLPHDFQPNRVFWQGCDQGDPDRGEGARIHEGVHCHRSRARGERHGEESDRCARRGADPLRDLRRCAAEPTGREHPARC